MKWEKVVAIIRSDKLREVEERLKDLQVGGISVTRGAGYGEYANLLSQDWFVTHARLEIYCEASRSDVIGQAIIDAAHTLSLIHISEPTRRTPISYAVFCLT